MIIGWTDLTGLMERAIVELNEVNAREGYDCINYFEKLPEEVRAAVLFLCRIKFEE